MMENRIESLNEGANYGALLTDLSKVFDCIMHDLLMATFNAYGFDSDSLNFVCNYLLGLQQRITIKSSFSTLSRIEYVLLQRSMFGSLSFNSKTLDLFVEQNNDKFAALQMIIHHTFMIQTLKHLSVRFRYVH